MKIAASMRYVPACSANANGVPVHRTAYISHLIRSGRLLQSVSGLKLLDPPLRGDGPLLPGEERMALGADFHFDISPGGSGFKGASAGARYFGGMILGMYFLFHRVFTSFQRSADHLYRKIV